MLGLTFSWARWQALFSLDQTKMCWNEHIFLPFCCCWHSLSLVLLPCWHLLVVPTPRPCPSCSCLAGTHVSSQGLVYPTLALFSTHLSHQGLVYPTLALLTLVQPRPCPSCSCLADTCPTKALSILLLPCWYLSYQGLVHPALALLTLVLPRPHPSCSCLADTCPTKALSILLLPCWYLSVLLFTLLTLTCSTKALSVGQPWHNAQEHSLHALFGCSKDHLFRGQQLGCCIHVFLDANIFNIISYYHIYQLHAGPTGMASEATNGHHHLHSRCTTQTVDSRWVVGISW